MSTAPAKPRKRPTKRKPNPVGRPSTYNPEYHCEFGHNLALLGLSQAEIADRFGIPAETLSRWKAAYPAFRQAIDSGGIQADGEVVASLYSRAKGMKVDAVKVVAQKDAPPAIVEYTDYLPPDVNAARLWLFNRQSARWRDRREVDVTLNLEQQIAQLTPEQRRDRLLALQAKAGLGLVIEGEAVEVEDGEE